MWRRADIRRGFSLFELMIAVGTSSMILITLALLMVVTAKSLVVSINQAQRQSEATQGLAAIVEILRNAEYPVTFVGDTEVRFTDVRHPGVTGGIWLNDQQILYASDMSDTSTQEVLASPVAGLTFGPDSDPLIGASAVTVEVSYNYESFRDYHPDESLNATLVTSVFMRNT